MQLYRSRPDNQTGWSLDLKKKRKRKMSKWFTWNDDEQTGSVRKEMARQKKYW